MSEEAFIIEASDLRRIYKIGYREVHALRGVDLQLQAGQFIGLKGRSGSGKTTLLNCLSGLDRPTSGIVKILGQDIMKMDDKMLTNWRRKQVGFVFQSFGLIPTLSAYENVELMMRIAGVPGRERYERTVTVLGLVGLTKWIYHRPYELSGGQQQRVAIARALANKPRLLLADEPTGELDSTTGREILTIFREVVEQENLTLLISSHEPMVDGFVDHILQLKDGQLVY